MSIKDSKLTVITTDKAPQLEIVNQKKSDPDPVSSVFDFDMLIDIKGWRAIGNKLNQPNIQQVKLVGSKVEEDSKSESFAPGESVDLSVDQDKDEEDQLGLF